MTIGFVAQLAPADESIPDQPLGFVRILGSDWLVARRNDLKNDDGSACDGLCDTAARTLFVDMAPNARDEEELFLHEALEAVNHVLDLQMNHTQITSVARGLWEAGFRLTEVRPAR